MKQEIPQLANENYLFLAENGTWKKKKWEKKPQSKRQTFQIEKEKICICSALSQFDLQIIFSFPFLLPELWAIVILYLRYFSYVFCYFPISPRISDRRMYVEVEATLELFDSFHLKEEESQKIIINIHQNSLQTISYQTMYSTKTGVLLETSFHGSLPASTKFFFVSIISPVTVFLKSMSASLEV